MKKFLLTMCLIGLSIFAFAQSMEVSGKVTSEDDGIGLPGVSVTIQGTTQGTTTNVQGNYKVSTQKGATLVFSFVGMNSQSITVGNSNVINVELTSDASQLSEVVVTALGVKREERSIGYAAQTVSGESLSNVRETNVVNSLSGKIAGVQIGTNSGAMGGSVKVTVRGISSLSGENNAMFVVDGVPFDNTNTNIPDQQKGGGGYDYGSPVQDINPNDIESVTVLKGAAATALWGSRGANGVILITTKKGSSGKGIGVNYTFGARMDKVYILPHYQNEYGGGYALNKLYYNENPEAFPEDRQGYYDDNDGMGSYDLIPDYATDESWGPKYEGQMYRPYWSWDKERGNPEFGTLAPWSAQPNNIRDFYETGKTLTNSIAFNGGNEKGAFRLSYSNLNQKFIMPNSSLKRNNFSFNGSYNLSKKLTVSTTANYVSHEALGRPGTGYSGLNVSQAFNQWGQRQWDMERMKNYQLPDGTQLTWNRTNWDNPTPKYTDNPYWVRYKNYQNDGRNRFFGNMNAIYKIDDNWEINLKAMSDFYSETQEERIALGSQDIPLYRLYKVNHNENNFQGLLTYSKNFANRFSLDAYAGGNIMQRNREIAGGETVDGLSSNVYNLNASIGRPDVFDLKREKQINSLFANATFGYDNTLFLDLTARNDWSSALPVDNNSYFYPSASLSWVFSENIKTALPWFSFGKLRMALASVGNDTDPYNTALTYELRTPFGSSSMVSVQNSLTNSNLKPEITKEGEIGLEVKLFNNRVGFNGSYYNRRTFNQIIELSQSAATGYNKKYVNAGQINNAGLELSFSATPIIAGDFTWGLTFNWAKNKNKIVSLTADQKIIVLASAPFAVQLQAREGESYGSIVGYNYVFDDNGNKIVGDNGRYLKSPEQEVLGSVLPDYVGGITNSFTYKGLSLSALIDFQKGGSFFSTTQMWGRYSGLLYETAANGVRENGIIAEGVNSEGKPNDVSIDANGHFFYNGGYFINAADVVDASYVYLREVRLAYRVPSKLTEATKVFNSASISLTGRNLWLMKSNSDHVDPSNITNSITNVQGLEGGALPSTRSMGFTLSLGI